MSGDIWERVRSLERSVVYLIAAGQSGDRAIRLHDRRLKAVEERLAPLEVEVASYTLPEDLEASGPFTSGPRPSMAEDQEPIVSFYDFVDKENGVPEQTGETDGELLARLSTDATEWAEEFLRRFRDNTMGPIDEGLMTSWFASAIETGRSAEYQTYVANADRIRLAKDALVATGYFEQDQVSDDIAPRITELVTAHNEGLKSMLKDKDNRLQHWRDQAIIANRKLQAIRREVAGLDSEADDEQ